MSCLPFRAREGRRRFLGRDYLDGLTIRTVSHDRQRYDPPTALLPKVSRAAARISVERVGSSTARASVSAPTIPATVAIARLRRLAAAPYLSRRVKWSSCARTCAV